MSVSFLWGQGRVDRGDNGGGGGGGLASARGRVVLCMSTWGFSCLLSRLVSALLTCLWFESTPLPSPPTPLLPLWILMSTPDLDPPTRLKISDAIKHRRILFFFFFSQWCVQSPNKTDAWEHRSVVFTESEEQAELFNRHERPSGE